MQSYPLRRILGRPALHIVIALCFAVAFFWPIFVLTKATETFHFLHAAWFLAIVASFAISRGQPPEPTSAAEGRSDTSEGPLTAGAREGR
jgi:hypothetical protein